MPSPLPCTSRSAGGKGPQHLAGGSPASSATATAVSSAVSPRWPGCHGVAVRGGTAPGPGSCGVPVLAALAAPCAQAPRAGSARPGKSWGSAPGLAVLLSAATRAPCNVPLSCLAAPPRGLRRGLCVNRPQSVNSSCKRKQPTQRDSKAQHPRGHLGVQAQHPASRARSPPGSTGGAGGHKLQHGRSGEAAGAERRGHAAARIPLPAAGPPNPAPCGPPRPQRPPRLLCPP